MNCFGLYKSPSSGKAVPGIAKPLEVTGFPLTGKTPFTTHLWAFLTDEQGNVKVVESKVNQHPPRIVSYCSCPGQKL